nr:MAG TPA: hypothetical protein [Caudoviricetes sp.]
MLTLSLRIWSISTVLYAHHTDIPAISATPDSYDWCAVNYA